MKYGVCWTAYGTLLDKDNVGTWHKPGVDPELLLSFDSREAAQRYAAEHDWAVSRLSFVPLEPQVIIEV